MSDHIIGIDIGTGSTKALAVDAQGKVIASEQVHYPTHSPEPGYCEQAPEIIWQAFVKCIKRLTTTLPTNPSAIVISSAMHSIMPVDDKGNALHDMIIWSDNRSASIARRIRSSSAAEMLYEQTGTPIHAMSPLCKLVWIRENNPKVFTNAFKFISIKEYVWHKIFNAFEVDHSIASAEGLMDVETFAWSENALDIAGLSEKKLSSLVKTTYSRSDCTKESSQMMGLRPETKFIIGASDGCLANLGSFATEPGIAALTIGTSGAVRVASKSPVYNFDNMTFNYRLDEHSFISGGPSNNGGSALKWFAESFLAKPLNTQDDYDAMLKMLIDTDPGADGLIFLPYLFGERAPVWNSDATGVFFGIRSTHTRKHFTRAVIEGISMALYDIADRMMNNGLPISQVHVSGGFVRSAAWLQILADIFNKKICLINADDASALGAAFLGMKTLGTIKDYGTLKPAVIKEISPRNEHVKSYQRNFKIYRSLYKNLSETMTSSN